MAKHKMVWLIVLVVAIASIVAAHSFSNNNSNALQKMNKSRSMGFAVVELFTSEGCSSCPPADKAVSNLLSKRMENVYILGFHVDYWNRLGWNDPFSQSLFSARQGKYASFFSLKGAYTPQIVVNGKSEFVGSDERRLLATVQSELGKQTGSDILVTTERSSNTVTVTYTTNKDHSGLLNIALVQPEASTVVKKGENGGRTLHHINIVRALHTINIKGNGKLTIEIPKDLAGIPLQLIAYTQSAEDFGISGADITNL